MSTDDPEFDYVRRERFREVESLHNAQQLEKTESLMPLDLIDSDVTEPQTSNMIMQPSQALPTQTTLSTSSRIVPNFTDGHLRADPSYWTRDNRLDRTGHADSTWLSWTADDRLAAQSLDRIRSQNLSIHLFNAYWLKQKHRGRVRQHARDTKGKASVKATDGETEDGETIFQSWPSKTWTNWPLPPDQVPREDDSFGGSEDVILQRPKDPRPSATLEECLIATTTRYARDRWRSRAWQTSASRIGDMKAGRKEKTSFSKPRSFSDSQEEPPEFDAVETLDTESDSDGGSLQFASQIWPPLEESSEEEEEVKHHSSDEEESDRPPTPLLDDEVAQSIVLPATRHILTKLDDLLRLLHNARQAYAVPSSRDHLGQMDSDENESGVATSTRARSRTRSGSRSRKRKRSHSASSTANKRPRVLNSRDWSDVIGMAHLAGWDRATVDGAATRCANLFGENMKFRTFFSGNQVTKEIPSYEEYYARSIPSPSASSDDHESDDEDTKLHKPKLIRTFRACTHCHKRALVCVPSTNNPTICQCCVDSSIPCSGITPTTLSGPLTHNPPKICPFPDCDRHHRPFKKTYHLQRHLDSIHHSSRPQQRLPSSPVPASSSDADYAAIICPVRTCPRHDRPFTRTTRLYMHIRTQHPEVDIDTFKRLESRRRGDSRGRYPRSRSVNRDMDVDSQRENSGGRGRRGRGRAETDDSSESEEVDMDEASEVEDAEVQEEGGGNVDAVFRDTADSDASGSVYEDSG